jgi:hypothetical protein
MRVLKLTIVAAALVATAAPIIAQDGGGQAVITVLPKQDGGAVPPSVQNQDLSVKVNGKNAKVTVWQPYKDSNQIELVVLMDSASRSSLGTQLSEIASFIKTLPPNINVAVGYMQNGRATLSGPLTADHNQVTQELHLPGGSIGSDASPYFCLSDLAKNWPSNNPQARREVVMVSDGLDPYQRQFDPDDPYVLAAISDAVKARLIVYAIYWKNQGRADQSSYADNAGQSLMQEVTQATGGRSFYQGLGNPVSFQPFLDELGRRMRNQYELGFVAPAGSKPSVESFKLNLKAPGTEVSSPQQVLVVPEAK